MKKNNNAKFLVVVKCLLCIVLCFFLSTLLFEWNRVMHFKNFIYLSHPMSKNAADSKHYAAVDAEIYFSNGRAGISEECYTFYIRNHKKDSVIAHPQVSTVDTLAAFFCPSIIHKRNVSSGRDLLQKVIKSNGVIENAFGVIRFSSPGRSEFERHKMELYNGGNSNSFIVQKSNTYENAYLEFWAEEDVFYTLLASLRKWELDEYRTSIFRFSDEDLMVNTYYGLGEHIDSAVVIKPQKKTSWTDFFNLLFAPYDISKATYDCMFLTNELDSTNVLIRFNESVEISKIDNASLVSKDLNSLRFSNLGVRPSINLLDGFYISFDGKPKTFNYDGWALRNYKRNEVLSFNVKFLESRSLQWIRLFFLTTIIAYLIAMVGKYLMQLLKKR